MNYLSLFSGIEAASSAWAPLGWKCVGVSEIEPFPCSVLAQRHPGVPNLGDITKITESDIARLGAIDLVVFGSPCQDLSVAGKRKGLDGERSGLFFAAMRIVEWARKWGGCRFGLWENVPGAFSSNGGGDFVVVVGQMAGLEYAEVPPKGWGTEGALVGPQGMVEWAVLDAQWFGVAQRRRRVFALTDFGDWAGRPPILLEPESLRGDSAPRREAGESVAGTFASRTGAGGEPHTSTCGGIGDYRSSSSSNALRASGADLGPGCEVLIASTGLQRPVLVPSDDVSPTLMSGSSSPASHGKKNGTDREVFVAVIAEPVICAATGQAGAEITTGYSPTLNCNHEAPYVAFAFNSNAQPDEMKFDPLLSSPLTCSQNSAVCITGPITHTLKADGFDASEDGTGRGTPIVPVSLTSMQVRRLTPRECERLQAFPDDHTLITVRGKPAADGPRYKALGNSMCVNVMHWIGKQIDHVVTFY